MVCKYCGAETDNENRICAACAFELNSKEGSGNDIFSSSVYFEEKQKEQTAKISREDILPHKTITLPKREETETKKQSNKKAKTAIVFLTAAVALLAVLFAVLGWFRTPSSRIEKMLMSGDTDSAYTLFVKHYNQSGSSALNKRLRNCAEQTVKEYLEGTKEYTDAQKVLETIKKMGVSDVAETLEKAQKDLAAALVSKNSFKKAEQYYLKKNYVAAITEYGNVIKTDSNYAAAQQKLTSAVSNYRNTVLSDAAGYVSDGDYDEAVKLLETALKVLEKDSLLEKRVEEYKKSAAAKSRTEVINTADKYAARSDYASAIRVVLSAIAKNESLESDNLFTSNLKYYRGEYEKQTLEKLDELVKKSDYNGAGALISEAEALLDNSGQIAKKKEELKGKIPTYLYALEPYESTDWEYGTGTAVDAFGFDRSQSGDYVPLTATSSATYTIPGAYKTFTCKLVAAKGMDASAGARVRVTATVGGEYRYRECVVKSSSEPQTLEINISDCTSVTISVTGEGANLLLYEAKFCY